MDNEPPVKHRSPKTKGYHAVHFWLRKHYGKADKCENPECQHTSTRYDWALIHGMEYDYNRNNFVKLCRVCHQLYDRTDDRAMKTAIGLRDRTDNGVCSNGHVRTEQNTKYVQRKWVVSLICKDCRKEYEAKRRERIKNAR